MKGRFFILIVLLVSLVYMACQQNPEEHYRRALDFIKVKEYKLAIEELDKAIEQKSNFAEAYLERGKIRFYNPDYRKANGDTNYLKNEFKLSVSDFTKAIELDSNLSKEAWIGRGNIFLSMKRYQSAIEDFENVLKMDSSNKQIIGILPWCKIQIKDLDGAKQFQDNIIDKYPDDAENYYRRAINRLTFFDNKTGGCEDLSRAQELYNAQKEYQIPNMKEEIEKLMKINCAK